MAGLFRRDERIHAQSRKLVDCLCRVIASINVTNAVRVMRTSNSSVRSSHYTKA